MGKRNILKAKYGIEIQEDTETGRLYYLIDGYSVFNAGVPKEFKEFVDKSFDNLVEIRKKDGYEDR